MTADLDFLVATAATVMRRRFAAPVSLQQPVVIKNATRSLVLRCAVQWPSDHGPVDSVIVKHMRTDLARGFTDWASLAFFAGIPEAHRLVPRFLGGDAEHRLFVLEDLGGSATVEDVLRTSDTKSAQSTLRSLAVTMARLQAATFGKESAFAAVRRDLPFAGDGRQTEAENWLHNWEQITGWFRALDCAIPDGLMGCAQDIAGLYANPGPFLSFSHGDPAPTNNHVSGGHVRLLDFEYGAFRHALYDLTGWNVLCPLPAAVIDQMSDVFRTEMARTNPVFQDDAQYRYAWAALSAHRAMSILTWIKPDVIAANRPWVDEQWTCRHAVLAAVLRMQQATAHVSELAPVAAAARMLAAELLRRWPAFQSCDELIPTWPAFAQ